MQNTLEQAQEQKFLDLNKWADDTISRIKINYKTQNVWPMGFPGPYQGYNGKKDGSTGDSFRQIYTRVFNSASGDTEKIYFFFNYYLYFVDMGVGRGRPWEYEFSNAKYNKLYQQWRGRGDRQQRPFLTMEIRHQIRRLSFLLEKYYAEKVRLDIVAALEE